MKITSVLMLLALAALAGCAGRPRHFGAPVSAASAVPVKDVLDSPGDFDGRTIVVEGTVAEVCQNRGCWLTMVSGEREMRVRFKDYAFFVPRDCSGRTARVEGTFTREMTPVEEARHYLEDAGRHDEAAKITEPVPGYSFLASGVELK